VRLRFSSSGSPLTTPALPLRSALPFVSLPCVLPYHLTRVALLKLFSTVLPSGSIQASLSRGCVSSTLYLSPNSSPFRPWRYSEYLGRDATMASLSFIMHMDDDVDPPPRPIQKDAIPATTSTSQGHGSSSISAPQSHASSRDVGQSSVTTRSSPPPPPPLPPLHPLAAVAASSAPITQRNTTSSSHAAPVVPSPSRLTASASRRESTTSLDSMDHTGYGSGASSSSIGGGRHPYRSLSRPISDAPAQETQQVRLTPITKRVSRAKKGVPVHVCDTCRPPKVCLILEPVLGNVSASLC
jgi:hypothetical protein